MAYNEEFSKFEAVFWKLSRETENLWNQIFKEVFPGSQSRIMYMLKQQGPMKMSDIADALQLTAGAVTTAANHLIEQNYLIRVPSTDDRRIIHLQLTTAGKTVLVDLENKGRTQLQHIFQHVSDQDLMWMEQIFSTAISNLHSLEQQE